MPEIETNRLFESPFVDQTEAFAEDLSPAQLREVTEKSEPYIGKWNELISTTNWEKGQIICKWRTDLQEEGAPTSAWSDERWSRMVGGVTPQHVGRLRRTFERFGHVHAEYANIYWSHFFAALDWDDAEMWLEGAVQNGWSVSQMRNQRWETLGKSPNEQPRPGDIVVVEADEESQALAIAEPGRKSDREIPEGPLHEGPDFGEEEPSESKRDPLDSMSGDSEKQSVPGQTSFRPFESFTDLPADVSEAADAFKIAIIRQRAGGWEELSRDDMVGLLEALKQLALAD